MSIAAMIARAVDREQRRQIGPYVCAEPDCNDRPMHGRRYCIDHRIAALEMRVARLELGRENGAG